MVKLDNVLLKLIFVKMKNAHNKRQTALKNWLNDIFYSFLEENVRKMQILWVVVVVIIEPII